MKTGLVSSNHYTDLVYTLLFDFQAKNCKNIKSAEI